MLGRLPQLEDADLSGGVYMEAAASLTSLLRDPADGETGGLTRLHRLDVRKQLGNWKASSLVWLRGLDAALAERHAAAGGDPASRPQILWD